MTSDEKHIDAFAQATAQAMAGATTDPDREPGFDDVINGEGPDPDLAQGEKD